MATKKDEARFTIKFNAKNPRHNEAIQILNKYGRGMASLIAESLCMYVHYGAKNIDDLAKVVEQQSNPAHLQVDADFKNELNSALDVFG